MNKFLISIGRLQDLFYLGAAYYKMPNMQSLLHQLKAWLHYCELYNAPQNEQKKVLGDTYRNHVLYQGHSRLTAYASMKNKNKKLAKRAWNEFTLQNPKKTLSIPLLQEVSLPYSLQPVKEAPEISTNYAAQWGLAALQLLQLLEEELPEDY